MSANLFIVGYPKSGTSVLWKYLREHPDVAVGKKKETYALLKKPPHPYVGPEIAQLRGPWSTKWQYGKEFWGKKARYYLDASPDYIYFPGIPPLIHKLSPNAKLIICLREPLSYLRSLHEQWRRCGMSQDTLVSLDNSGVDGDGVPAAWRLNYLEQISRVTKLFGPDQLKIVLFEEFKRDNQACMCGLWSFLNLPPVEVPLRQEKDGYALPLEDGYMEQGRIRLMPMVEELGLLLRRGGYLDRDLVTAWGYPV